MANLNLQFRDLRFKEPGLIFCQIIVTIFFTSIINIVILGYEGSAFLKAVHDEYAKVRNIFHPQDLENSEISSIVITVILGCYFFLMSFALIGVFSERVTNKRAVLNIIIIHHSICPFALRFSLEIFRTYSNHFLATSHKVLGSFILVIGIFLETFYLTISCSSQPKNENWLVTQKYPHIFIKSVLSFVLIFATEWVQRYEISKSTIIFLFVCHILISISTISNFLINLAFILKEFFYYNQISEIILTFCTSFELSFQFLAFISTLITERLLYENILIIGIICTFLLFFALNELSEYRKNRILFTKNSSNLSRSQTKIFLRTLSALLASDSVPSDNNTFVLNNLRKIHREKCGQEGCGCRRGHKGDKGDKGDEGKFEVFLVKKEIEKVFLKESYDVGIILSACFISLSFFGNFTDLLYHIHSKIVKGKMDNLSFFEKMEIECFKLEMKNFLSKKVNENKTISIELVEVQDKILVLFCEKFSEIVQKKSVFWAMLSKKEPNFEEIDKSIKEQRQIILEIDESIPNLIKKFNKSKSVMELLNIFELCIKMKSKISKEVLQHLKNVDSLENEKIKILKNLHFSLENLMFDKESVVFECKVEKNSIGIIYNVSKNVREIFGHNKESILGRNINEIMPKSMQKEHDKLLEEWRENCTYNNIERIRYVFAMNKENVCFESSIYLKVLQREESINLVANFIKGNENDYMLINNEGIIDGLGKSFIDILGIKSAKLPFNFICNQSAYIMKETFNGKSDTICLSLYHVKELDKGIEEYLYKNFSLDDKKKNNEEITIHIKEKSRSVRMTLEYRPYKMGEKEFTLLKLIEVHGIGLTEVAIQSRHYFDNPEEKKKRIEKKIKTQKMLSMNFLTEDKEKVEEESFNASQFSVSKENGNIFSHLEEKLENSCKSSKIFLQKYYFCILFIGLFLISFVIFILAQLRTKDSIIQARTAAALSFMRQEELFILSESRIENLAKNIHSTYDNDRLLLLLQKLSLEFEQEQVEVWNYLWENSIKKSFDVFPGGKFQILVDQFFTYYQHEIKMKQKLMDDYSPSDLDKVQRLTILDKLLKHLENGYELLKDSIFENFTYKQMLTFIKGFVIIISGTGVIMLLWKIKALEIEQKTSVRRVLLSISDFNCLQCQKYYKNLTIILLDVMKDKENQAKLIENKLIDGESIHEIYNHLTFEKEKYEFAKTERLKVAMFEPVHFVLLALLFGMILETLIVMVQEYKKNQEQINFSMEHFDYFDIEKQTTNNYFLAKSKLTTMPPSPEELDHLKDFIKAKEKSTAAMTLNVAYLNLISTVEWTNKQHKIPHQLEYNSPVCQFIQILDPHLYEHNCLEGEAEGGFWRMKIYEVNAVVEKYLTDLFYALGRGLTFGSDLEKDLGYFTEMMEMKAVYRLNFLIKINGWIESYKSYNDKGSEMDLMVFFFIEIIFQLCSLLTLRMVYLKIKYNCYVIFAVPENIIRKTKGAVKHLEKILSIFS